MCNHNDLRSNLTISLFISLLPLLLSYSNYKEDKSLKTGDHWCFRWNETANSYWILLQIIFGSHNILKATNRVAPIRKKQQSEWQNPQDVPTMWPGRRGEVGLGCPCFKLCPDLIYTMLKWIRIKTIITPLLTSPMQPLFIMAYSPFAPLSLHRVIRMLGKWAAGRWHSVGGGCTLMRGMIILVIIYWAISFSKTKFVSHSHGWRIKQPESVIYYLYTCWLPASLLDSVANF